MLLEDQAKAFLMLALAMWSWVTVFLRVQRLPSRLQNGAVNTPEHNDLL
jgi:hypothetical protein